MRHCRGGKNLLFVNKKKQKNFDNMIWIWLYSPAECIAVMARIKVKSLLTTRTRLELR